MLLNLMTEQLKLGITPVLLNIETVGLETGSALVTEATTRGISVVNIRLHRGYKRADAYNIIELAHNNTIDLIHSHSYKINILIGSLSYKARMIPVICTAHGWTSVSIFSRIWLYNVIDKIAIRRLDAVVYVNPVSKNVVLHRKFFHVGNGIPPYDFNVPVNIDDFIKPSNDNEVVIGTILRLSEEKGLIYLLESVRLLVRDGLKLKLVVIGDGPNRKYYDNFITSHGLECNIRILGYQTNAFRYLPLFDLFVLPSLTEGLPITILEAMQSETPIIATNVGSVSHVLGDGKYGVIVRPGDSKEMANAIRKFIENVSEYKKIAELSKIHVLKEYSSHAMAQEYLSIYREVINESR